MFTIKNRSYGCPVELTMSTIGGKWKVLILWRLRRRVQRYSELHKSLPTITHKMLAQQLRELEADGIIYRQVYPVVPPKVEYSLTEEGRRLIPVLETMRDWGMEYMHSAGDTLAECSTTQNGIPEKELAEI